MSKTEKDITKEEKVEEVLEKEEAPSIEETFLADNDNSINLVPILSRKEIVSEEKKTKLNIGAIISIIIFLLVTIVIVVFSTISKIQVQNAQNDLAEQEAEVRNLSSIILSNEEILKRIYLYQDISSDQYSARKIFDYFTKIAKDIGDIQLDTFDFQRSTLVTFEGKAPTIDGLSRFWYVLGEDEIVDKVTLDSFNKGPQVVTFEFKVFMKEDSFSTNLEEKEEI